MNITASDIVAALEERYLWQGRSRGWPPAWSTLTEFSLAPGGANSRNRRIDMLAVHSHGQNERHAIEIKVSRSDLLRELKKPEKSEDFAAHCHRFYLATPPGLVKSDDTIPENWGVIEVNPEPRVKPWWDGGEYIDVDLRWRARVIRQAAIHEPLPIPESAFVEAMRRASRAERSLHAVSAASESSVIVTDTTERNGRP